MTPELIEKFYNAYPDARYVLCRDNKAAFQKAWQTKNPSLYEMQQNISRGGRVGIVPFSIGYTVLDVDYGNWLFMAMTAMPLFANSSLDPNNMHLWYPDTEERNNGEWYLDKDDNWYAAGEVRGANGYVIIYDDTVRVMTNLDKYKAVYYETFEQALKHITLGGLLPSPKPTPKPKKKPPVIKKKPPQFKTRSMF